MGMNQHEKPAPPARRWDEALDPHAHQGPYRPPAALLDILARAAGANSYEAATTAVRHRAASAATELHEAGLDPRVIGLIAEPRVNELLGVAERSARSLRQRDRHGRADAATGAHSPALVSQGRISAVIAAKPTDRRAMLEEAAGITGLYARRHEAELRLRATDANLQRLQDIVGWQAGNGWLLLFQAPVEI